eukprot:g27164.t1
MAWETVARPVLCVDTGEVFPSILQAAKSVGRSGNALHGALKHGTKCGGFRWQRLPFQPPGETEPVQEAGSDSA